MDLQLKPLYVRVLAGALLALLVGDAWASDDLEDSFVRDDGIQAVTPATVLRPCNFAAPGNACIFDLSATTDGTLTVCTTSNRSADRWRVIIARRLTGGAVSAVGSGSTTTCTGAVSETVISGARYVVGVIYDSPIPGTFPTTARIQFTGPVTVFGPRPRSEGPEEMLSCGQEEPISCGTLVSCRIDPVGDRDDFTFRAPEGAMASISIGDVYFREGAPCWDLLSLGSTIGTSCGQAEVGPLAAGSYTIRIYWRGGFWVHTGNYGLSLQGVSESFRCGVPIEFGDTLRGSVELAGDTDTFNFRAQQNQIVEIEVADVASRAGSPCWALFSPEGQRVTSSCGTAQSGPLLKTGTYAIKVWWAPGAFVNTGPYTLSLRKVR